MHRIAIFAAFSLALTSLGRAASAAPSVEELIRVGVEQLIAMQESDGAWPYEGVYRVAGQIPIGYRVGGTAIVCQTLLAAAPEDAAARAAIERGVEFVLSQLDDERMTPSTKDAYDVRVWGHCYALELFCRLRAADRMGRHADAIRPWFSKLVEALITEELKGGGWNYANRRAHAAFVTAPVTQTLLLAREQGEQVPDEVLLRARRALTRSRFEDGAYLYSGVRREGQGAGDREPGTDAEERHADSRSNVQSPIPKVPATRPTTRPARPARTAALPGSIARSAICESTLLLLDGGSADSVQRAVDAFHAHWDELEKRRGKTGTHAGPYGIAPYYFYYGHRYAAQAIQMLPENDRARERARMLDVILRTRADDGTWNDRVFPRSRNYGTAMIVLALLGDRAPLPPALNALPAGR
ncbi:MAG: hypothetical protein AB7Q17_13850 [Phycisphaerae bacterium]